MLNVIFARNYNGICNQVYFISSIQCNVLFPFTDYMILYSVNIANIHVCY